MSYRVSKDALNNRAGCLGYAPEAVARTEQEVLDVDGWKDAEVHFGSQHRTAKKRHCDCMRVAMVDSALDTGWDRMC